MEVHAWHSADCGNWPKRDVDKVHLGELFESGTPSWCRHSPGRGCSGSMGWGRRRRCCLALRGGQVTPGVLLQAHQYWHTASASVFGGSCGPGAGLVPEAGTEDPEHPAAPSGAGALR